jgi:hypothetical protein
MQWNTTDFVNPLSLNGDYMYYLLQQSVCMGFICFSEGIAIISLNSINQLLIFLMEMVIFLMFEFPLCNDVISKRL